ncbi:MAG: hypothetical protein ACI841_000785 [Planctomycetota bacterium]
MERHRCGAGDLQDGLLIKQLSAQFARDWQVAVALAFLTACGGSSAGVGGRPISSFKVEEISVNNGDVWRLNQPIDIRFTADVDFETVNLNTVQIVKLDGAPVTGSFSLLADARTVRFAGSCPTSAGAADAGFSVGSEFLLNIVGSAAGAGSLRSTAGDELDESRSVRFSTPAAGDESALFLDLVPGPPRVRVRGRDGIDSDDPVATYLELGGDDSQRVYFAWDAVAAEARLHASELLPQGGSEQSSVPLNLYSLLDTRIAIVVELNQAVAPGADNINSGLIGLETLSEGSSSWVALQSSVELVYNCTETGAQVRVTPVGILPQAAGLRVNLRQGLRDLTGNSSFLDQSSFAVMQTIESDNPIPDDVGVQSKIGADELLESFVLGGDEQDSLEDRQASFSTPHASWGEGRLEAAFDFEGTGGPGGDFDWHIPEDTTLVLDTTSSSIFGGPNGTIVTSQTVINGVFDVRDLYLPQSSSIRVQGPNTCTILASGKVELYGHLSLRGASSNGVNNINSTTLPELGAPGQAGGGRGGTGSYFTNQNTPRGGRGFGAFNQSGGGGEGGESCFRAGGTDRRRAAGGGGGRLGKDVMYRWNQSYSPDTGLDPLPASAQIEWPPAQVHPGVDWVFCQELLGLDAEAGRMGGPEGYGAESQGVRAAGGAIGPSPFLDERSDNDFLGLMVVDPGPNQFLVRGELDRIWAGAGGGGGGDASNGNTYPQNPFAPTGDERGAGGGGGAGGLQIYAVGEIIIGSPDMTQYSGGIDARGGNGANGERVFSQGPVGGGSGGGSGGHIVISSAKSITINGHARGHALDSSLRGRWYNEPDDGHSQRIISLNGGQGGAGQLDRGGADVEGPTPPRCDCIPYEVFPQGLDPSLEMWPYPLGAIGNGDSDSYDFSCFRPQAGVGFSLDPGSDRMFWEANDPDNQASPAAGGDGSPGILQLHVTDPVNNLIFTNCERLDDTGVLPIGDGRNYGDGRDVTQAVAPPPIGWHDLDDVDYMVPFFGVNSTSQSRWIPLGAADASPEATGISYQFRGTDLADGSILVDGLDVLHEPPILGPVALDSGVRFADELTRESVIFDASGLTGTDELYRRNPALMRQFTLTVSDAGAIADSVQLEVVTASYDPSLDEVQLFLSAGSIIELENVDDTALRFEVIPHMFRVRTSGTLDQVSDNAGVRVTFSGTWLTDDAQPDEIYASTFTTDIRDLDDPLHPIRGSVPYDFFRFRVFFTLNSTNNPSFVLSPSTPRPSIEYLRIPFEFGNTDHHR